MCGIIDKDALANNRRAIVGDAAAVKSSIISDDAIANSRRTHNKHTTAEWTIANIVIVAACNGKAVEDIISIR